MRCYAPAASCLCVSKCELYSRQTRYHHQMIAERQLLHSRAESETEKQHRKQSNRWIHLMATETKSELCVCLKMKRVTSPPRIARASPRIFKLTVYHFSPYSNQPLHICLKTSAPKFSLKRLGNNLRAPGRSSWIAPHDSIVGCCRACHV